jgi:glucose-1-phosphate cytidylyltransferase
MDLKNNVNSFTEKPRGDGQWVNGGFFVLSKKIFKYIKNDNTIWEKEPLEKLSSDKELKSFKHSDFWKPMDTLRDKESLEDLWLSGKAPWKSW